MTDLGTGCCLNRDPGQFLFAGMINDLAACKAKCAEIDDCGFIEYGWAGSKWCTVIGKDTDCSELADGPEDCGAGGGDNGVHTYMSLSSVAEQCKIGSMGENEFVRTGWQVIPGLTGAVVKDIFVSHSGTISGAYV